MSENLGSIKPNVRTCAMSQARRLSQKTCVKFAQRGSRCRGWWVFCCLCTSPERILTSSGACGMAVGWRGSPSVCLPLSCWVCFRQLQKQRKCWKTFQNVFIWDIGMRTVCDILTHTFAVPGVILLYMTPFLQVSKVAVWFLPSCDKEQRFLGYFPILSSI